LNMIDCEIWLIDQEGIRIRLVPGQTAKIMKEMTGLLSIITIYTNENLIVIARVWNYNLRRATHFLLVLICLCGGHSSVGSLLLLCKMFLASVPRPLVNFSSAQLESGSKRSNARRTKDWIASELRLKKGDVFSCKASPSNVLMWLALALRGRRLLTLVRFVSYALPRDLNCMIG